MPRRYEMDWESTVVHLVRRGWLVGYDNERDAVLNAAVMDVRNALVAFQAWHGLDPDAWAGRQTERFLTAQNICSHPDYLANSAELVKWPSNEITWTHEGSIAGLPAADQKQCFNAAWAAWAVCGLKATYTPNAKTANVLMGVGVIDKPHGILAHSTLPQQGVIQVRITFDLLETFVSTDRPLPGQYSLIGVAAHEIGHGGLGIGHLAAGNLMAPKYNPLILGPQAGDIEEAVARYGPLGEVKPIEPTPVEPRPIDPPPPNVPKKLTLEYVNGEIVGVQIPGWQSTKL